MAVLVLTLMSMPVLGQEFTKRTQLYKSEGMIIRDVSGDSWLVFDRYCDANAAWQNVFILFTETGVTAEMMYLPEQVAMVNDFEIYDRVVYFAGSNTQGVGIMGYFNMASFPTATVKICEVPVMASFERLDVGVYNNTLHVFLTGEALLGGGHMADARLIGTDLWRFEISLNTLLVDQFDDVSVLSRGVAFSARNTNDKNGFIFFFLGPATGSSVFSATVDYCYFSSIVSGRILLDVGSGDNLAYVFQNISGTDEVGFMNWNTMTQRYIVGPFAVPPYTYRTIDLSYGQTANKAELLMEKNSLAYAKEIYTARCTTSVPPIIIPPYDGHAFSAEEIYSLDAVGSSGGLFVAAGVGVNDGNLAIYRYHRNNWPEQVCTEYVSIPFAIPAVKVITDKYTFEARIFDIEAEVEQCEKSTIPVVTKCHEDRNDR